MTGSGDSVKSADRVLDIFELLAEESRGLTVSEVSSRLEIPRSSAHGLVQTLLRRGYLIDVPASRTSFRLGVRLIQLGLSVADALDLRSAARVPLENLTAATGETAFIAVPDGGELVYLDKVINPQSDFRTDARLGARRPLHSSSLGKALLAGLGADTVASILEVYGMHPVTRFTLTDPEALFRDLAETRACGYSTDEQEAVLGICCVGAPIRDHNAKLVAAVSVSTVRESFDSQRFGRAVLEAALEISRALGWTGDARSLYEATPGSGDTILRGAGELRRAAGRPPRADRRVLTSNAINQLAREEAR